MKKYLLALLALASSVAHAGFPPVTSQGIGDSAGVSTFNFQFPNFAITHNGPTASLGVLTAPGGGTGLSSPGAIGNVLTSTGSGWVSSPASGGSLPAQHDLWVDRNGSDVTGCGTLAVPCQTVGYAFTLVTSPSQTNNWTVHLMSGRHDQETGDLLIPPYTFIQGFGGPDVGSYLRLPSGKALKLGSGWTSNARGGVQSVYFGGSTSINLDFATVGGSAGSNFILDDVFVTGSITHTGRGVNGGDFLYLQNVLVFGSVSLTGSELETNQTTFAGSFSQTTSSTVPTHATLIGGSVGGAFSFTETNALDAALSTTGVAYFGTFTTVGTLALTTDANLPIGYTLSGGTTRTNSTNATALAYTPGVSGNWATTPALVSSALDQIAVSGIAKAPGQLKGSDGTTDASAGNVGEYVESVQTSFISFGPSAGFSDVVSIVLTAGDWEVTGVVGSKLNSSTLTSIAGGISTTVGNSGTGLTEGNNFFYTALPTVNNDSSVAIPPYRAKISATTTYYLKAYAVYSGAVPQAVGRLSARRVR